MKLQLKRKIKRRKRKRSNTQARNGKQVGVGDRVLVAQKRRNKFSTKFQVKQENPDYEEEILSGRKHGGQRENREIHHEEVQTDTTPSTSEAYIVLRRSSRA